MESGRLLLLPLFKGLRGCMRGPTNKFLKIY